LYYFELDILCINKKTDSIGCNFLTRFQISFNLRQMVHTKEDGGEQRELRSYGAFGEMFK